MENLFNKKTERKSFHWAWVELSWNKIHDCTQDKIYGFYKKKKCFPTSADSILHREIYSEYFTKKSFIGVWNLRRDSDFCWLTLQESKVEQGCFISTTYKFHIITSNNYKENARQGRRWAVKGVQIAGEGKQGGKHR